MMKTKRHLTLRLLVMMVCWAVGMGAAAYDYAENGIYYTLNSSNGNATVTNNGSFNSYSGDVVIPETVTVDGTTYTVASIGYQAFKNSTGMTSVTIPNTVVYMMNEAFMNCSSLTHIEIPSSVISIYNYVFQGCSGLTSVTCSWTTAKSTNTNNFDQSTYSTATLFVPSNSISSYQNTAPWSSFSTIQSAGGEVGDKFVADGIYYLITSETTVAVTFKDSSYNSYSGDVNIPQTVTLSGKPYTVTQIGERAFYNCSGLTGVSIPVTVTSIGDRAFFRCGQLESIQLPASIQSIGYAAFYSTGLGAISLPLQLTTLGDWSFGNCTNLVQVTIPAKVTEIGMAAFQECSSLNKVTIRNGVQAINNQAFYKCTSLSHVSIPSSVTRISNFAFMACYNLTNATLPEGLETIGGYAFAQCIELTTVNIPSTVSEITYNPWYGCSSLTAFTVASGNTNYCSIDGVLFTLDQSTLVAYPNMLSSWYQVPSTVTRIDDMAFGLCDNLMYVMLPDNLVSIGSDAFNGTSIYDITIPASTTTVDDGAFSSCDNLTAINVDSNNSNYASQDGVMFNHEYSLLKFYPSAAPRKHYTVPSTVLTIGEKAFYGSSKLKSIYIPGSVNSIEPMAFQSSMIERLVIDEGVTSIAYQAFAVCFNLKVAYIPSTVNQLDEQSFYGDTALTDLVCARPVPPTLQANAIDYCEEATLYVPAGASSSYQSTEGWSDFNNIVETQPLASGVEFEVDSILYTTLDADLNAKVSGTTVKTIIDPGLSPKVVHEGNLCTVTQIGSNAMQNCTRMASVEVPHTATLIDSYAFYSCSSLGDVRLHEGLKQMNSFVFSHNDRITHLSIPSTVDSISSTFVNYCNMLKTIDVSSGNTHYKDINGVLFSKNGKRLIAIGGGHGGTYIVPDGTEVIETSAMRGYYGLYSIELPKSLRKIGESAFFDNTGLEHMYVPNGATTIGTNAFSGCIHLMDAELPSTLTSLGYLSFHNTPVLERLSVKGSTPPTCMTRFEPRTGEFYAPFDDTHYTSVQLLVPTGSKAAYQAATIWKNFTNIVETDFPVEFTRGDVNDDGLIDVTDVTMVIAYALGRDMSNNFIAAAADVNGDGDIDVSDVTLIINYVLGHGWPDEIDMWYLLGQNVGDNSWSNIPSSVGYSLLPMYPVGQFTHGKGILTYTAWFNADDYIMLIHEPGNWEDKWGRNSDGQYGIGQGYEAFSPGESGYYTITFNTDTKQSSFTPYTEFIPQTFNTITLTGDHNYWNVESTEYSMSPLNLFKENHEWVYRGFTVSGDNQMKFVADNQWIDYWGSDGFPFGIGISSGDNVPVKAGTYDIYFNDITGHYNFIKK